MKYKEINGTSYHKNTKEEIIKTLEYVKEKKIRIEVSYGDVNTGRDWEEIHDTKGYVSRSTGSIKIPLLIYNVRSYGGGALLDHCVVKIVTTRGKEVLYQHSNYHKGVNMYTR